MFRMHSRHIGPGTLVVLVAISLAAIAAFEVAAFDPVSPALAQTPSPVAVKGVFDSDLADVRPDAIGQLRDAAKKAHRDCYPPRATFKVMVKNSGDSSFDQVLGRARADALAAVLPSLGLDPGQFKTGWATGGSDEVQVSYDKFKPEDDHDSEEPKFKVVKSEVYRLGAWVPLPNLSKVKKDEMIKVTIVTSERYEDGHKSWPSGVSNIQLIAFGDGVVKPQDYERPTLPCKVQLFEATYKVPHNPPAIVVLKAIAHDGSELSNENVTTLQFPTKDLISYDVKVTGHEQSSATTTGERRPDLNGTDTITVDWTTTFTDVLLKNSGGADVFVIGPAVPGFIEGGTTDVKYTFDETRKVFGGPCHGTIQLSALGTHLKLGGVRWGFRNDEFSFWSQLDMPAAAQLMDTMENQTRAECRNSGKSWPRWGADDTVAVVNGLTIKRFFLPEVIADRHDLPKGPLLSPLKELSTGDAFSFTTGEVQRSPSCGQNCNATAVTEIKVNVTPHQAPMVRLSPRHSRKRAPADL